MISEYVPYLVIGVSVVVVIVAITKKVPRTLASPFVLRPETKLDDAVLQVVELIEQADEADKRRQKVKDIIGRIKANPDPKP